MTTFHVGNTEAKNLPGNTAFSGYQQSPKIIFFFTLKIVNFSNDLSTWTFKYVSALSRQCTGLSILDRLRVVATGEKLGLMNLQGINSRVYNNEGKFSVAFLFCYLWQQHVKVLLPVLPVWSWVSSVSWHTFLLLLLHTLHSGLQVDAAGKNQIHFSYH